MKEQEKKIAKRRKQSDEFVYSTNGRTHQISAKGDAAKGLAAAASAIGGFIVALFLLS